MIHGAFASKLQHVANDSFVIFIVDKDYAAPFAAFPSPSAVALAGRFSVGGNVVHHLHQSDRGINKSSKYVPNNGL
jgi:hypothetical protein